MLARLDVLYCPLPIITGFVFYLLKQDGSDVLHTQAKHAETLHDGSVRYATRTFVSTNA